MVAETGLEKEKAFFASFHKAMYPLQSGRFRRCVFHAAFFLVVAFHQNNDQTTTKFHACFFRPNFTGRASAKASQALAWAVSKVWA